MTTDDFREQSRQTWDAVAPGWEARDAFLEANMGVLSEWIVTRVAPTPGDIVLDLGAGPGDLGHRFADLVAPHGTVISTDFSARMVDVARRLGTDRGLTIVEYRQLDAEDMALDDDSVDAIVARAVLMLVSDPVAAFAESRRVLRPGGSLAFTVFSTADRNPWAAIPAAGLVRAGHLERPRAGAPGVFSLGDAERLRHLVADAGFTDIEIDEVDVAFHYRNADDAWNAIGELNGPLAATIADLTDDERATTRRAVLDGYQPFRHPDGSFPVPGHAVAVHAR